MVKKTPIFGGLVALTWMLALATTGHAQQQILAMPRAGGYSAGYDTTIGAGGVGRPAVSPYANLPMIDLLGLPGGYQTLVQPFVRQNQVNNAQQGSIQGLQRQVTSVQAQTDAQSRRPNGKIRETGHQTRTMNFSHYYPVATPQ